MEIPTIIQMTNQEHGEINGTSPHKVLYDIISHFIVEDSPQKQAHSSISDHKKDNTINSERIDTNDGESQRKINKTILIGKNGGNTIGSQPTRTKRGLQKNRSQ
uniref:Putative ovule protein n=1 Tax=Solanum chacoense TaxID=4108 RepID=A0A0V0HJQ2_SOLCH